jgi:hypothetical protein
METEGLFTRIKRAEREAGHSPSFDARERRFASLLLLFHDTRVSLREERPISLKQELESSFPKSGPFPGANISLILELVLY